MWAYVFKQEIPYSFNRTTTLTETSKVQLNILHILITIIYFGLRFNQLKIVRLHIFCPPNDDHVSEVLLHPNIPVSCRV
jgi:hypothetical protein